MIEGSCLCGEVRWQFNGNLDSAVACNCTACRRYGVLWGHDFEGEGITVSGTTQGYAKGRSLEFDFCATCGCLGFWRALDKDKQGRVRVAVNLRLAGPQSVAHVEIDRVRGLRAFDVLPRDGRRVSDYSF